MKKKWIITRPVALAIILAGVGIHTNLIAASATATATVTDEQKAAGARVEFICGLDINAPNTPPA